MIEMKLDRVDAESIVAEAPTPPEYPYGLELSLDDVALSKLGMSTLPALGTSFMLEARVKVTGVSANESLMGGSSRHVSLQICAMELDTPDVEDEAEDADTVQRPADAQKAGTADTLYAQPVKTGGHTKIGRAHV